MIAMPANDRSNARIAASGFFSAPRFAARDLAPAEIPYALPLVRATWPAMDHNAWRDFTVSFCADSTLNPAITALSDPGGGLCGLFASRIDDLRGKRVLAVPLFTVIDIGNSLEPVRALVAAVEAKAADSNCSAIDIRLGQGQAGLRKRLLQLREKRRIAHSVEREIPSWPITVH